MPRVAVCSLDRLCFGLLERQQQLNSGFRLKIRKLPGVWVRAVCLEGVWGTDLVSSRLQSLV